MAGLLAGLWHRLDEQFDKPPLGLAGAEALGHKTAWKSVVLWLRLIVCRGRSRRCQF